LSTPSCTTRLGEQHVPEPLERLDEWLGIVTVTRGEPLGDRPSDRRIGPGVGLLAADYERQDALGCVLADADAQSTAPRHADEVRTLERERIEHSDRVGGPDRHAVRRRIVGLVAAPEAAMVGIDVTELVARQPLRDAGLPYVVRAVEQPTVEQDGHAITAVVLEVHRAAVDRVRRVRHVTPPSSSTDTESNLSPAATIRRSRW
jgi:hypothetical protein